MTPSLRRDELEPEVDELLALDAHRVGSNLKYVRGGSVPRAFELCTSSGHAPARGPSARHLHVAVQLDEAVLVGHAHVAEQVAAPSRGGPAPRRPTVRPARPGGRPPRARRRRRSPNAACWKSLARLLERARTWWTASRRAAARRRRRSSRDADADASRERRARAHPESGMLPRPTLARRRPGLHRRRERRGRRSSLGVRTSSSRSPLDRRRSDSCPSWCRCHEIRVGLSRPRPSPVAPARTPCGRALAARGQLRPYGSPGSEPPVPGRRGVTRLQSSFQRSAAASARRCDHATS